MILRGEDDMIWKSVEELCETLCESTPKLTVLHMLASEGPKKLENIIGSFVYPDFNLDVISMEESGLLYKTQYNELKVTKLGHSLLADLERVSERYTPESDGDRELKGIASRVGV